MRHTILVATICTLVLSAAAPADTVHLSNGGKVVGKITEIKLKIGPLEKTLPRDQVRSVKCGEKECEVLGANGTVYEGKLSSVAIRCVAGVLSFGGKSVKSVSLGDEPQPKRPKRSEELKEPVPAAEPHKAPPARKTLPAKLSPEERNEIRRLLKAARTLRNDYLKQASDLTKREYAAIRKRFQGAWDSACDRVAEQRRNLGKYARDIDTSRPKFTSSGLGIGMTRTTTVTKSGAASAALSDLNAAEARLSRLRSTIRRYKAAVAGRAHLRAERVRAYYDAVYRYLLKSKGKGMPEDAMKEIFEKALRGK